MNAFVAQRKYVLFSPLVRENQMRSYVLFTDAWIIYEFTTVERFVVLIATGC